MPFACVIAPSDALQILQRLEHAMLESYALGSPNTDHLISLSRLNIHKAIDVNIRAVGMDPSWMTSDDSTSIFNKDDAQLPAHAIPPSLAPTEIQRTVPHHPWLDIFPFPSLRDFLISAADELDDETLCHDMCAFWDTRNSGACLMIDLRVGRVLLVQAEGADHDPGRYGR
ncbi:hypothetical protein ISF_03152 [Cordyceps fumosorosea ARSEF 2679]|uniref:Uncharacterized protein n=1 Tax=Cordyceps fumosorosea (strain ARSEF 2679) TaxID=1081104 RepID=A0A162JJH9_CORFA|nr:hypothetical protein ISF_03152 [Cordyceps fumosorosea ARSEF 2679]OAA69882.1 hypothetical protein ISF_03152 [Cordyceps fumosorosea ARSEF 2679]